MEPYERSKLSDAFKDINVVAGQEIIKQGDTGNDLYILQEGEAYVTKDESTDSLM
jgi:CRP-like cAMP-binding protein